MKILKVEEFENEWGLHERRIQSNGCSVTVLKVPSEKYKAKHKKRHEENMLRLHEKNKSRMKENLIKEKMRENAIKQLQADGILDDKGEVK